MCASAPGRGIRWAACCWSGPSRARVGRGAASRNMACLMRASLFFMNHLMKADAFVPKQATSVLCHVITTMCTPACRMVRLRVQGQVQGPSNAGAGHLHALFPRPLRQAINRHANSACCFVGVHCAECTAPPNPSRRYRRWARKSPYPYVQAAGGGAAHLKKAYM